MARSSDPTNIAIEQAVKQDAELAQAARSLATKAISVAMHHLTNGSPKMQLDVVKAIMPAIGRAMADKGEDAELSELRKQLQQLMAEVRGDALAS
jgi:hypothetical protein